MPEMIASVDARALADRLLKAAVSETISLAELSRVLGRPITRHRHLLYTALGIAQREGGVVFHTIRGVGYQRLAPDAVAATVGTAARRHIRRTARVARRSITAGTSRINDLPPATQRRVAAEISALSLVEHITRDAIVMPKEDAPLAPEPVAMTARRLLGLGDGSAGAAA